MLFVGAPVRFDLPDQIRGARSECGEQTMVQSKNYYRTKTKVTHSRVCVSLCVSCETYLNYSLPTSKYHNHPPFPRLYPNEQSSTTCVLHQTTWMTAQPTASMGSMVTRTVVTMEVSMEPQIHVSK